MSNWKNKLKKWYEKEYRVWCKSQTAMCNYYPSTLSITHIDVILSDILISFFWFFSSFFSLSLFFPIFDYSRIQHSRATHNFPLGKSKALYITYLPETLFKSFNSFWTQWQRNPYQASSLPSTSVRLSRGLHGPKQQTYATPPPLQILITANGI